LHVTRYGGLIIDTPGMRELQLLDHTEGIQSQFSDVEELLKNCRFIDCQHESEPDCAINRALEKNELSEERWRNYLKLAAEIRHGLNKQEKWRVAEQKKIWKKNSVETRNLRKFKMGSV
jgi:ribosome biogenesis GTPase